jgi:hypothetical protein
MHIPFKWQHNIDAWIRSMNKSTWKNIRQITMALFFVLLVIAYTAFTYSEIIVQGNLAATYYIAYPYQPYAIAIGVCSIISGIISIGSYLAPKYISKGKQPAEIQLF